MDVNTEVGTGPLAPKKPPRKPRPSEIAAKKAKAAKKPKAKVRHRKQGPKALHSRTPKRKPAAKRSKAKARTAPAVRTERLDLRVSKTEKRKVIAKALKLRRTITSLVLEAIEKLK